MNLNRQYVNRFIDDAIQYGDYEREDNYYLQNLILEITKAESIDETKNNNGLVNPTSNEIAQFWIQQMLNNGLLEDVVYQKEIVETKLLDLITPKPSTINREFWKRYESHPEKATGYFYQICKRNHYVKEDAIAKNIHYYTETEYGDLEITINLSKPEKDAKEIAKAREAKQSSYPANALCMENEGFVGSVTQAARRNHRIVRLNLNHQPWGFQFSPYAYFPEHSIVLSEAHEPMKIEKQTFSNLLQFVQKFPHYFAGSNADLPIVGGSILSHNHYQTGRHTFPMDHALLIKQFKMEQFPDVQAAILKWPMSVIRLKGEDLDEMTEAADHIFETWKSYTDEKLDIRAYSQDGTRHHTVTPIARFNQTTSEYELDLVLRDNQTSTQYPDGIFHPHNDVHHIKKENIGLIEVMGTAILPGRLKKELLEVERYVLGDINAEPGSHKKWADKMKEKYNFNNENAKNIIHQEVGRIFKRVLEDSGVFKQSTEGQKGFEKFIQTL